MSGKQSFLNRGIFPGEVLGGAVSCGVLFRILETGLCLALSPFLLPVAGRP